MPSGISDVEAEIDRLYQLPLAAFTEARNSLAVRLRPQDREAAARVRSLPRPPASAWAVNQVFWTARREFDALIDAGDLLRALHAAGATASELRDAMRERRLALSAALRKAEAALEGHGHAVGAAIQQRVAASFEALAFYGSARPAEIRPGRFTQDLSPPGFDALAALPTPAPRAPRAAGQALPVDARGGDGRAEEAERARAELAQLENEVSVRRRQAETARNVAEEAARRVEGARSEHAEAERRLTKAAERARESAASAEQAQAAAAQAGSELAAAEAALEKARRSLPSS